MKTLKRGLFLLLAFTLLIIPLSLPALAAETSDFYFIKQPVDAYPNDGGTAYFSVEVYGDVASYLWQGSAKGFDKWYDLSWVTGNALYINYDKIDSYQYVRCVVTSSSGEVIESTPAALLSRDASLLTFATRAIRFATDWVGSVVSALISPDGAFHSLLPILAIGIAITGLLVCVKIFKSFSWGT